MTTTAAANTRKFTTVSGGHDDGFEFHVHSAGCQHIGRYNYVYNRWTTKFDGTAKEFVAAEVQQYEEDDQGWSANDHRIFPCAK